MIEALKSLLSRAAQARSQGDSADAERLYREAAEEAKAKDALTRAEALVGSAQIRRDKGDRIGASIYLSEAITLLRSVYDTQPGSVSAGLAHALRHAADIRSELREYAVAGAHIQEAIRLYRAVTPLPTLDLANALRVAALNNEREAAALWGEAEHLYASANVAEGVSEARSHLQQLGPSDPGGKSQ